MKTFKVFSLGVLCANFLTSHAYGEDLQTAIQNGSVNGNIRAYYNTREFETEGRSDVDAFALGGALRAETGQWGWVKLGLGYYTAQDLGTNNSDPAKVNGSLGSELEVLAEAYVTLNAMDSALMIGRQKINTPFANAGDAFIIPLSFEGYSLKNTSISDFTFEAVQINTIKNRNSDEFIDVGRWSTSRYGLTATPTSGTTILGATMKKSNLKLDLWFYEYADLFQTLYTQLDYTFAEMGSVTPFLGAQFTTQSDTGDELLGEVDSTLFGLQAGISFGSSKLTLGFNEVSEEDESFNNGAFLTPYTFSTSPLFTNNMVATLENVDAGDATKLTFNHSWDKLKFKASYAVFDYANAVDRNATDLDITYDLSAFQKGLTVRWRFELIDADDESAELINHRFQLQLTF